MSTLGGSRGERNAKPKFSALDINSLYRSSRGETLEPSTQKNAIPRKHGMQSLGKVPSARRPANLPSMKAEISTPGVDTSWGGATESAASNQHSGVSSSSVEHSSQSLEINNISNSITTTSIQSIQSITPSPPSSNQYQQLNQNQQSSTSWSAVTTGQIIDSTKPPLYQSPQFQYEFPSLDGSIIQPQAKGGRDRADGGFSQHYYNQLEHSIDGQHQGNSKIQTDLINCSEQQEQQQSGSIRDTGDISNVHIIQPDQGLQQVPPQFRALMPPFMYRSSGGAGSNNGSSSSQCGNGGNGNGNNQTSSQYGSGIYPPSRNMDKPRGGTNPPQQNYDDYRRRQTLPLSNTHRPPTRAPESTTNLPEVDVTLQQRPIIKDEDLERMDTVTQDEGWARSDEIDYNQQLVFSDDEGDSPKELFSSHKSENKKSNNIGSHVSQSSVKHHDDDNHNDWLSERQQTENLDRERIECEPNDRTEDKIRERELLNINNINNNRVLQNGIRIMGSGNANSGTMVGSLDADIVVRVKQRQEEEEKRELERKQAATKKLQALEQRMEMTKKKDLVDGDDHLTGSQLTHNKSESNDYQKCTQIGADREIRYNNTRVVNRDKDLRERDREFRDNRSGSDRDRDYNRFEKYDREVSSRDASSKDYVTIGRRDGGPSDIRGGERNTDNSYRSYQANLPPRLQKQQQQHNQQPDRILTSGGNSSGSGQYSSSNRNPSAVAIYSQPQSIENKNVPFAQQYDPRYIHSQNHNKINQQNQPLQPHNTARRNTNDDVVNQGRTEHFIPTSYNRKSIDSDGEDRSIGGRDSGRNSIDQRSSQLTRSISDSSQRKASVSSEDKPLSDISNRSDRSTSREPKSIPSWADEIDTDAKQGNFNAGSSSSINKTCDVSSNTTVDNEPKHILQRPQKQTIILAEPPLKIEKESSEERDIPYKSQVSNKEKRTTPSPTINRLEDNQKLWSECDADSSIDLLLETDLSSNDIEKDVGDNLTPDKTLEAIQTVLGENDDNFKMKGIAVKRDRIDDINKETTSQVTGHQHSTTSIQPLVAGTQRVTSDSKNIGNNNKRVSPRGGRHDMRGPPINRGGYSYRGNGGNNWNRRGGGRPGMHHQRHNDYCTESDHSDEEMIGNRRNNDRNDKKLTRKDLETCGNSYNTKHDSLGHNMGRNNNNANRIGTSVGVQKEGFLPRGEPSRRGRGGMPIFRSRGSGISSNIPSKRIDNYGPPSSKSPFGATEEKIDNNKKEHGSSGDEKCKPMGMTSHNFNKKVSNITSKIHDDKPLEDKQCELMSEQSDESKSTKHNKGFQVKSAAPIGSVSSIKNTPRSQDVKKLPYKPSSAQTNNNSSVPSVSSDDLRKDIDTSKHQSSQSSIKKDEKITTSSDKSSADGNIKDDSYGIKSEEANRHVLQETVVPSIPGLTGKGSTSVIGPQKNSGPPPGITHVPGNMQQQQQNSSMNSIKTSQYDRAEVRNAATSNSTIKGRTSTNVAPRFAKNRDNRNHRTNDMNTHGANHVWDNPVNINSSNIGSSSGLIGSDKHVVSDYDSAENYRQPGSGSGTIGDKLIECIPNSKADNGKQLLDGTSPPVNTIIFENTNFKSMPPAANKRQGGQQQPQPQQSHQHQSQQQQLSDTKSDDVFKQNTSGSFHDILDQAQRNSVQQQPSQDSIAALHTMSFSKSDADYEKDMKMAFTFENEINQLTEDKTSVPAAPKGGLCISRATSIHVTGSTQNTISPSTADLNMKIASVKKVWENVPSMPTVLEHSSNTDDTHLSSNFVAPQHHQHLQPYPHTHANIGHVQHALSPGPGGPYSTSFGPDPSALEHFAKAAQETVEVEGGYSPSPQHVGQGNHTTHQSLKHAAEALATNTNVCKVKPTQQQLHQSALGISSPPPMQQNAIPAAPQQYYHSSQFGGMSAIPSPPAVVYNSSPMPSQGGLYGHFQLENRSQFSQYHGHYGAATNAPYANAYMQAAPPNIQTAPTPDMYQNLTTQFRMGGAVQPPFNQTQQLNNPSTVLISSTSNSLMSASVKPSSQQIGAIGSKSGSQQYGQQYMSMYAAQQAPPPPPQLQSNNYYSAGSAGGQGAFFGAPTAGGTQNYSLQAAGMFGGHGAPPAQSSAQQPQPTPQQVPNFGSPFINSPSPLLVNRQYQGVPTTQTVVNATAYMKSMQQAQSHIQDPWEIKNQVMQQQQSQTNPNRPPGTIIGAGSNIGGIGTSAAAAMLQQQSNNMQSAGVSVRGQLAQRYPTPIQRPSNYPQSHPQQPQQQSQQSQHQLQQHRQVRQHSSNQPTLGNVNKHYYVTSGPNNGLHGSNGSQTGNSRGGTDQTKPTDKSLENSTNSQESIKDEGSSK